jgi:signal transduction histidine kinase
LFTEPFRATAEDVFTLPPREFERRRRAGLLRLILISVALVLVFPLIPAALIGQTSALFAFTLVSELLLAGICLIINGRGYETLAAAVFVFSTLFLGLDFAVRNPDGLSIQVYLIYAILAVVPLIAGLVLPIWVMWLAAVVLVGVTIPGVLLTPAPRALPVVGGVGSVGGLARVASARYSALALLLANQALAAAFSWMYARNASAGVRGAIRAIERERELIALKDQFLIDANHELRTPIMAWYNNVELLHQLGARATDEQRARVVARALASGDAVLRLLQTVLDAGALDAGVPHVTPQPVALGPLLRSVLDTFDPETLGDPGLENLSWQSRPVDLRVANELLALADADRVRQVLINLLSNALKYSAPGTPITLAALALPPASGPRRRWRWSRARATGTPAAASPRFAQVSVGDRGLGIPPREAPKLFQRFVRLERDITGPVRGTGVGLYLCRMLVEAMGGRIWVESSGVPGEGSTFRFTLPLAGPASGAPASGAAAPAEPVSAVD